MKKSVGHQEEKETRELEINTNRRATSIPEGSSGSIPVCSLRTKSSLLEKSGLGLLLVHRITGTGGMEKRRESV